MKVLSINTFDLYGGAARAAFRLHEELRRSNVDSRLLVQEKRGDHANVFGPVTRFQKAWNEVWPHLDKLP